jgi:predicted metal-dependent peptidase
MINRRRRRIKIIYLLGCIKDMANRRFRDEFPLIKSALLIKHRFIASLLARARIYFSKSIEAAAVDNEFNLYINEEFMDKLDTQDRIFVLAHETLHLALLHSARTPEHGLIWNYAADAVVNNILTNMMHLGYTTELNKRLREAYGSDPDEEGGIVTMRWVHNLLDKAGIQVKYEDLEVMSVEEIYNLLLKLPRIITDETGRESGSSSGNTDSNNNTDGNDGDSNEDKIKVPRDVGVSGSKDEMLQEGDSEIYQHGNDRREMEKKWKEALAKDYVMSKTAGTLPAGLERIIDDILKAKVDWRSILRESVRVGLGRTIVSTYKRPSRKHQDIAGHQRYTLPHTWVLVDTSGSIGNQELAQFLGEIYDIAKQTTVTVLPWDAEVYEPLVMKSKNDIHRIKTKIKGGGGTVIQPVLQYTLNNMKPRDMVVVLTDGHIYDLDDDITKGLFADMAHKASVAVLCSTSAKVEIPNWRFAEIRSSN